MADKNYKLTFVLSDGTEQKVQFTAPQGPKGDTPQKGVDYFTEADQDTFIQKAITDSNLTTKDYVDEQVNKVATDFNIAFEFLDSEDELPADGPAFGTVYVVNGIIYKYGEYEVEVKPPYTNQLPISTDWDDNVYNGVGYKDDTRSNSSGVDQSAPGWDVSGFIPAVAGDVIRFKNVTFMDINGETTGTIRCALHYFDGEKKYRNVSSTFQPGNVNTEAFKAVYGNNGDIIQLTIPSYTSEYSLTFIRIIAHDFNESSVVTINEEIVDLSLYNNVLKSVGYVENKYISASNGYIETNKEGVDLSGYIPVKHGDIIYLKNITMPDADEYGNRVYFYNSEKAGTNSFSVKSSVETMNPIFSDGNLIQFTITGKHLGYTGEEENATGYIRIGATNIDDTSIVTVNEEITDKKYEWGWHSTNQPFIPGDNEDRITALESDVSVLKEATNTNTTNISSLTTRVDSLENSGGIETTIPSYWQDHLDDRVEDIRKAMVTAGRHKSAFLWYHDSHWNNNSKMSPKLLKYLYENTPINRINYGGDIVDGEVDIPVANPEDYAYLYEWRKAIRDLPNHHSVRGNHDDDVFTQGQTIPIYSFLMAAEETPDIVRGSETYYYIDEPSERTRYLYLDTYQCVYQTSPGDPAMTQFIIDSLNSLPTNWHLVAISHIWWLYNSVSTPNSGNFPDYCRQIIDLFTAYNKRQKGTIEVETVQGSKATLNYNFTNCAGAVEFCIGGHTHIDQTFWSEGTEGEGFPIILTETDSKHLRGDSKNLGTSGTNESSVNAIVANYFTIPKMINIIRVGRGQSRTITYDGINQVSTPINFTLKSGKINCNDKEGTIIPNEIRYAYTEELIPIESRKSYALIWKDCTISAKICYYDANGNFIYNENLYNGEVYLPGINTGCVNEQISTGSAIVPIITEHPQSDGTKKTATQFRLRIWLNKLSQDNYEDSFSAAQSGLTLVKSN